MNKLVEKEIYDLMRKRAEGLHGVLYDVLLVVAAQRAYDKKHKPEDSPDPAVPREILQEAWRLAADPDEFGHDFGYILGPLIEDLAQRPAWQRHLEEEADLLCVEAPFQSIERNRIETASGN